MLLYWVTQSGEAVRKVAAPNLINLGVVLSACKTDYCHLNAPRVSPSIVVEDDIIVPVSKVAAKIVLCPVCVHATCICVITPVSGISCVVDISGVSTVDALAKVLGTRHPVISNENADWFPVSGLDPARPISDGLFCLLWEVDQNGGSYHHQTNQCGLTSSQPTGLRIYDVDHIILCGPRWKTGASVLRKKRIQMNKRF